MGEEQKMLKLAPISPLNLYFREHEAPFVRSRPTTLLQVDGTTPGGCVSDVGLNVGKVVGSGGSGGSGGKDGGNGRVVVRNGGFGSSGDGGSTS